MEIILAVCLFVGTIIGVLFLTGILGLYRAFWIHYLWGWFLVPLGVPNITIPQLYGILILLGVLQYKHEKYDSKEILERIFTELLSLPLVTLFGYAVKVFLL